MHTTLDNRLLSTFFAGATVFAIATFAEAKTVIHVMHQGDPGWVKAYGDVAKRFEQANPDVDIELIYAPHDAYNEKFSAAVMAKQLPDIMELDAPFLANYAWSGYLQPIKPLIDQDLLDDMTESNIAQSTYPIDKQLYAVGLTDSSVVLYSNKKYLEAIGARIPKSVDDAWTREEFEGYLEKLSKLEGVKWPIDTFRGYGIKTEWITYAYGPSERRTQLEFQTAMATAIRHGAITHAFQPSFACQGFYWVQLCRVAGRKEAEDNSDQGGAGKGHNDRARREDHFEVGAQQIE